MKTVQIPESLFAELCRYFLLDETTAERESCIRKGLDAKLESIVRRELYGKYKRGDEQARLEYLNRAGISEDYRW